MGHYLLGLEKRYLETKSPEVIPEAVFVCAMNDFPMPEWCAMAYIAAFRDVKQFRAGSWDDVFGRPHQKGTHLEAKRQKREKEAAVYLMVKELKEADPETPIDGYLFEKIGRSLAIGSKTLTENYYYAFKKRINDIKQHPAIAAILSDYIANSKR